MSETYQAFYVNEVRKLEITVNDEDGNPFTGFTGDVSVLDSVGQTIIPEAVATVDENTISTTITQTTTAAAGDYKIVWKISKSGHIYYHITELAVLDK
jgi:hypothetical protein